MTLVTPAELLSAKSEKSDIRVGAPAFAEIGEMLRRHGLDVAFWVFQSSKSSSCGRSAEDGGHISCPVLTLFFRRHEEFLAHNPDPHFGNWRDDWRLTARLREDLNIILHRHGYDEAHTSPYTFIFLDSWEDLAIDCLGRLMKPRISRSIAALLPSNMAPTHIFWHSSRTYFLVFAKKAMFDMALAHRGEMERIAAGILSDADSECSCSDHSVIISLKHMAMKDLDLWGMARED